MEILKLSTKYLNVVYHFYLNRFSTPMVSTIQSVKTAVSVPRNELLKDLNDVMLMSLGYLRLQIYNKEPGLQTRNVEFERSRRLHGRKGAKRCPKVALWEIQVLGSIAFVEY